MATISLAIILRSLTAIIAGPISLVPASPFGDNTFNIGSVVISILDISIIIWTIVLMAIFYFFFNKTRWGIAMKAPQLILKQPSSWVSLSNRSIDLFGFLLHWSV
jgi:branched-subunit amino acid ABC-type transport system permease component